MTGIEMSLIFFDSCININGVGVSNVCISDKIPNVW